MREKSIHLLVIIPKKDEKLESLIERIDQEALSNICRNVIGIY